LLQHPLSDSPTAPANTSNHDDWLAFASEWDAWTATATLAAPDQTADWMNPLAGASRNLPTAPAAGSEGLDALANPSNHDDWLAWLHDDGHQTGTATATLDGVPDQADRINPLSAVSRNRPTTPAGRHHTNGFVCTYPGCRWTKPFKRKADLERHEKKHRRPDLDCSVDGCDRKGAHGFHRQDKLRDHQRKKHGMKI
jgi:hypothetical protein